MKIKTNAYASIAQGKKPMQYAFEVIIIGREIKRVYNSGKISPWLDMFPTFDREPYSLKFIDNEDKHYQKGYITEVTIYEGTQDKRSFYLKLNWVQRQKIKWMNDKNWIKKEYKFWLPFLISVIALTLTIYNLYQSKATSSKEMLLQHKVKYLDSLLKSQHPPSSIYSDSLRH